jgi:hypothetical protein
MVHNLGDMPSKRTVGNATACRFPIGKMRDLQGVPRSKREENSLFHPHNALPIAHNQLLRKQNSIVSIPAKVNLILKRKPFI